MALFHLNPSGLGPEAVYPRTRGTASIQRA